MNFEVKTRPRKSRLQCANRPFQIFVLTYGIVLCNKQIFGINIWVYLEISMQCNNLRKNVAQSFPNEKYLILLPKHVLQPF